MALSKVAMFTSDPWNPKLGNAAPGSHCWLSLTTWRYCRYQVLYGRPHYRLLNMFPSVFHTRQPLNCEIRGWRREPRDTTYRKMECPGELSNLKWPQLAPCAKQEAK